MLVFKITFFILTVVAAIWLVAVGALLFALQAFTADSGHARAVASGSIYIGVLALSIVISVAIILPALLVLQPLRLWRVLRAERHAVTPRQRFRGEFFRSLHISLVMNGPYSCIPTDLRSLFRYRRLYTCYRLCFHFFINFPPYWARRCRVAPSDTDW